MTKSPRAATLLLVLFILAFNLSFSQDRINNVVKNEEQDSVGNEDFARTANFFDAEIYVDSNNDTLLYRLLKPLYYDPQKKYPIVVCLSGSKGRGNDNIKQIAGCWPAIILSKIHNRKKYQSFVFVPQCPTGSNWGKSLGLREEEARSKLGKPVLPSISPLVFKVLDNLENEFSIDTTRRYVTGQSMGAYGTWHFILTQPDMFAAAIPICGGANPDFASKIVDVPVWAFHGQQDDAVPVQASRNMINAIKKSGGNPRYTEYPDVGHMSWILAYKTPNLLDWLFAQKIDK